jgi:hypothetical protein
MARSAALRKHENDVPELRPALSVIEGGADIKADSQRPTHGVHPGVYKRALLGVAVFLVASLMFLTGNPGKDFDIFGVTGFAIIFFTLTLGLGRMVSRDRRWGGPSRATFREFVRDNVATATGTIAGREAMVEILILPTVLAAGMVAIGLVFLIVGAL